MPLSIKNTSSFILQLILTDPAEGFTGINKRLDELAKVIPHAFLTSQVYIISLYSFLSFFQFSNPANPAAHYRSTGPEIWQQTNGQVDIVCFGIGTGGTITGVGNFLKEQKPSVEVLFIFLSSVHSNVQVYAIEPEESAVLSGNPRGPHKIQGIGAGIIPDVLDRNIYKEIIKVNSEDSLVMARRLAEEEGILGGISSGANVVVACRVGIFKKFFVVTCDVDLCCFYSLHKDLKTKENLSSPPSTVMESDICKLLSH